MMYWNRSISDLYELISLAYSVIFKEYGLDSGLYCTINEEQHDNVMKSCQLLNTPCLKVNVKTYLGASLVVY